jgi:hypothetical protein
MRRMQDVKSLNELIEAGSSGYLPLFYQDWITESFSDSNSLKKISFSRAAETVHKVFEKIDRHTSIERKKTAIQAMDNDERKEFIISFMKMVEYRTLDRLRELH